METHQETMYRSERATPSTPWVCPVRTVRLLSGLVGMPTPGGKQTTNRVNTGCRQSSVFEKERNRILTHLFPHDHLLITSTGDHEARVLVELKTQHTCVVGILDRLHAVACSERPDLDSVKPIRPRCREAKDQQRLEVIARENGPGRLTIYPSSLSQVSHRPSERSRPSLRETRDDRTKSISVLVSEQGYAGERRKRASRLERMAYLEDLLFRELLLSPSRIEPSPLLIHGLPVDIWEMRARTGRREEWHLRDRSRGGEDGDAGLEVWAANRCLERWSEGSRREIVDGVRRGCRWRRRMR
jgi:hypothetical protein